MMRTFLTALLALGFTATYAQFTGTMDAKTATAVKHNDLTVLTLAGDPKIEKKLAKSPDALNAYHEGIDAANQAMEDAMKAYWKVGDYTTITPMELKKLRKTTRPPGYLLSVEQVQRKLEKGEKEGMNQSTSLLLIPTNTDPTEKLPITAYRVPLPRFNPLPGDIIYGIRFMNDHILGLADMDKKGMDLKKRIKANGEKLRNKTLLLDKADIDDKLDEAKIAKAYPAPLKVELSTPEEMNEAITTESQQFACCFLVKGTGNNMFQAVVFDASTGQVLATSNVQGASGAEKSFPTLKDKNLKDFAKAVPPMAAPAPKAPEPVKEEVAAPVEEPAPAPAPVKAKKAMPTKKGGKKSK